MRKITQKITSAFTCGQPMRSGNDFTDGKGLYLHDNLIAEHREDGMYITNAGWQTNTTKERLNALPGVSIVQKKGAWYMNGEAWDGSWIKVNTNTPPPVDNAKSKEMWNKTKVWVKTGGYRGYERPVYAVCGANDTGTWEDSPCRSEVAKAELEQAKRTLGKAKIPCKIMTCETSNVFCVHHYLIVRPMDVEAARKVIKDMITSDHKLLYSCDEAEK